MRLRSCLVIAMLEAHGQPELVNDRDKKVRVLAAALARWKDAEARVATR